jgi:transposase
MPGKKTWGRKRHLLVDTLGLLLAVSVHAANIEDRAGARLFLPGLQHGFARISHLFADHAYDGAPFREWLKEHLGWHVEIVAPKQAPSTQWALINDCPVKLSKPKTGFHLQHKRWVVERTFAWLTRFRRLARDYESLPTSSEALIKVASIRLLLTRLSPSPY